MLLDVLSCVVAVVNHNRTAALELQSRIRYEKFDLCFKRDEWPA